MLLLGLTGGIGAGKTFLSDFIQQKPFPVVDTDVIARQLLEPGQPVYTAVRSHLGASFFHSDGQLDRPKLASLIFSDVDSKNWLNQLMHPIIRQQWKKQVLRIKEQGEKMCVVVIPLLFETKAQGSFDKIICMACSPQTQRSRLEGRGWDKKQIEARIASQWSMTEKMFESHFVIWTDCSKESTKRQCDLILNKIL